MDLTRGTGSTGKVAIVLTVKDEADDLLPWIAWYLSLGADTIFVFDDGSGDDTFEMAELAGLAFDVRAKRMAQDGLPHTERQRDAYLEVLRDHGREFDWIGFFDADEYLDLPPGTDIHAFLDRAPDIGAVGINWCNYGSSDNVLKPNDHPFTAYTHHFAAHEDIGRHVKTFVRPSRWSGRWFNVHYFELSGGRYVDPIGNDIVWSQTPGVTRDTATWQGAKLMHYQCRSLEHFLERMKKRPDLPKSTRMWIDYDNNTVRAEIPLRRRVQATSILQAMVTPAVEAALHGLRFPEPSRPRGWFGWARRLATGASSMSAVPAMSPASFWRILSDDGFAFRVRHEDGTIFADLLTESSGTDEDHECLLLTFGDGAETAFLLVPGLSHPVQMRGEVRVSSTLRFDVAHRGDRVTLRNPDSHRYLSALPLVHGGSVVCDRFKTDDWETFRLLPAFGRQVDRLSGSLHLDRLAHRLVDPVALLHDGDAGNIIALTPLLLRLTARPIGDGLRTRLGTAARYVG